MCELEDKYKLEEIKCEPRISEVTSSGPVTSSSPVTSSGPVTSSVPVTPSGEVACARDVPFEYDVTSTNDQATFQELLKDAQQSINVGSKRSVQSFVQNLMESHIRSEPVPSPMIPTVFFCEICAKTFTQNWILNKHYSSAHGYTGSRRKRCQCGKIIDSTSKHMCHKCTYCVLRFPSKLELRNHISSQHIQASKKCDICSETFTSQQLLTKHTIECRVKKGPDESDKNKKIVCDKCNGTLVSYAQYNKHESNYNSLSHTCPVCNKRFCLIADTFRHVWMEHHRFNGNPGGYTCPLCPNDSFEHYRGYAYHIIDTHEASSLGDKMTQGARKYLLSQTTRRKDRQVELDQQDVWDYEGEYLTDEPCEKSDFTRTSSRIEEKISENAAPTMLGKKKKIEHTFLPPKKHKPRPKVPLDKNTVLNS